MMFLSCCRLSLGVWIDGIYNWSLEELRKFLNVVIHFSCVNDGIGVSVSMKILRDIPAMV